MKLDVDVENCAAVLGGVGYALVVADECHHVSAAARGPGRSARVHERAGSQAGRCTLSVHTAGARIAGSLRLCRPIMRLRKLGKEGTMTARPEGVAMLADFDAERAGARQRYVHRDGRPFTVEETELIDSATDEDMRAAAGYLAAAPQRLTKLIAPDIHAVAEDTEGRRAPAEGP